MLRRLRDVALSVPVVITVNDCVATVARADAADLPVGRPEAGRASDGARGVPSEVGPSSSRGRDAAWVVLDRTATRLLTFARGDMVYLKTPSDPNVRAVRRLVALEGDWVTAADSDEVQKIPKGHCRLERVAVRSRTTHAASPPREELGPASEGTPRAPSDARPASGLPTGRSAASARATVATQSFTVMTTGTLSATSRTRRSMASHCGRPNSLRRFGWLRHVCSFL